jgi:hypothetical protein
MAAVLAAGLAWAQRGGGMGGSGGMGDDESGGMGGMGGRRGGNMGASMPMSAQRRLSKAELVADKLKLNKDQKEEFQTILNAARERAGSVRVELDKQRAQIAGAMIDGKTGEELQKLVAGYAGIAAQMTRVEADAFGKIYAMLKPNQQSKAAQAFELMAGMFGGPAGGGRGAGTGRARGEGR